MITYIERRGWCSSAMCPSTVDKSTQPCPILSSSIASTSLISSSNTIPISTDTISLLSSSSSSSFFNGKKQQPSAFLPRSSLGHPNDYYTKKRIDDLHERMDDVQIASFVKFLNYHLAPKHKPIEIQDLSKDLSNGHIWVDLIEILSSSKLKREHGRTRFHALTNVQYVLDYLKLRMQHINISPHEIVSGNRKQILALLWMIMKTFDFPGFRLTSNRHFFSEQTLFGYGQDRSTIITWLNHLLNQSFNTRQIYVQDFYLQTWISTCYLPRIVKYLLPLSNNYLTRKSFDYLKQLDDKHVTDQERFQFCLDLSNYCFYTITIIDYHDKSEKSLFKFFTEFQMNIFNCLKTHQIGKLSENNPYIKQLLDTVIQTSTTAEHSSALNNQEQYLICLKDEQPPLSDKHLTRSVMNSVGHLTSSSSSSSSDDGEEPVNLRTVEKSRSFTEQQQKATLQRQNRWNQTNTIQSDSQITNGHTATPRPALPDVTKKPVEKSVVAIVESESSGQATKEIQQSALDVEQSMIVQEESQPPINVTVEYKQNNTFEEPVVQLEESPPSIVANGEHHQSINNIENTEQGQTTPSDLDQTTLDIAQPTVVTEENTVKFVKNEPNDDLEQYSRVRTEKLQPILVSNEEHYESTNDNDNVNPRKMITSDFNRGPFIVEQLAVALVDVQQRKVSLIDNELADTLEQPSLKSEEPQKSLIFDTQNEKTTDDIELFIENEIYPVINKQCEPTAAVPLNEVTNRMTTTAVVNELSLPINETFSPANIVDSIVSLEENQQSFDEYEQHQDNTVASQDVKQCNPIIIEGDESPQLFESLEVIKLSTIIQDNSDMELQPSQVPVLIIPDIESSTIEVDESSLLIASNHISNDHIIQQETLEHIDILPSLPFEQEIQLSTIRSDQPATIIPPLNGPMLSHENQHCAILDEPLPISFKPAIQRTPSVEQSTIIVKESDQSINRTAQQAIQSSSTINEQLTTNANSELQQATTSRTKQPYSAVLKRRSQPSATVDATTRPIRRAIDEKRQILSTNLAIEPKPSKVLLEQPVQLVDVAEEPLASVAAHGEANSSSARNKKPQRTNPKHQQSKKSIVKTIPTPPLVVFHEDEDEQIELMLSTAPILLQSPPLEQLSTLPKTTEPMHKENSSQRNISQSRKTKKKKTSIAPTMDKPSSPIVSTATTAMTNRNLFAQIKEYLRDPRIVPLKYAFLLFCVCFTLIIIVLHQ